jgi:hypothetical protein
VTGFIVDEEQQTLEAWRKITRHYGLLFQNSSMNWHPSASHSHHRPLRRRAE